MLAICSRRSSLVKLVFAVIILNIIFLVLKLLFGSGIGIDQVDRYFPYGQDQFQKAEFGIDQVNKYFPYGQDQFQKAEYIELLRQVDELFSVNNISYALYSGTLLGALRHHGFIPWDDDSDVMVRDADFEIIKRLFEDGKLVDKLSLQHWQNSKSIHWKIFFKYKKITGRLSYSWPFVDLFRYIEKDGNITIFKAQENIWLNFTKSLVFPLVRVPFEDLRLPVPRHWSWFVETEYGKNVKDVCVSQYWNHKIEEYVMHYTSQDCHKLKPYFPFVERTCRFGKVHETLKYNDTNMNSWLYDPNHMEAPITNSNWFFDKKFCTSIIV